MQHTIRSFHAYNIEELKDPQDAALYLTEALLDFKRDHNVACFLKAIKDVTESQGGVGALAKRTALNRQNLYKVLSAKRQPKIETIGMILDGLGLKFQIVPKEDLFATS
ncbi:MAG: transcriptional regulator [Alphaproteobacteria bacterium]|nr:transcriptional regulator [Alphaproteobacteria bacterium]